MDLDWYCLYSTKVYSFRAVFILKCNNLSAGVSVIITLEKEYFVETFWTFSAIRSFYLWTVLGIWTLNFLAMASCYLRTCFKYILLRSLADAFMSNDGGTNLQLADELSSSIFSLGFEHSCISILSFWISAGTALASLSTFAADWLSYDLFFFISSFAICLCLALFWFFILLKLSSECFCLSFCW